MAQPSLRTTATPAQTFSPGLMIVLVIAGATLAAFVLFGLMYSLGLTGPRSTRTMEATTSAPASVPDPLPLPTPIAPRVGDPVVLSIPGNTGVYLANAEDTGAWDAMLEAENTRDQVGMNRLIAAERVFHTPVGTRGLLLESGFASRKVRLLDGPYAGQAGWVQVEAVSTP